MKSFASVGHVAAVFNIFGVVLFSALFRCCRERLLGYLLFSCVALPLMQAHAASDGNSDKEFCSSSQSGCIAVGEWDVQLGVGVGFSSNPLLEGNDIPLFVIPEIRYYGERFFFDTYTGGFTFYETGGHFFNAVATIGFEQVYFKSRSIGNFVIQSGPILSSGENPINEDGFELDVSDANNGAGADASADVNIDLNGLHKRHTAGLVGLEYGFYRSNWELSLQVLQDATSVHEGQEVRAAAARFFTLGMESLEVTSGFTWQSGDLLNYYYGIDASEVTDPAWVYKADAGVSPFIRFDWRRRLLGNWSWQATVHYRWLASEITASPLLDENAVLTLYFGGVYHF